jgi:hypothetical protein
MFELEYLIGRFFRESTRSVHALYFLLALPPEWMVLVCPAWTSVAMRLHNQ